MQQVTRPRPDFTYNDASSHAIPDWRNVAGRAHCVQFYHDDDFLIESIAAFVEAGLDAGEPCLVIATPGHRQTLKQRLLAHGSDIATASAQGKFVMLDAAETLERFMVDGMPDRALFEQTLAPIFERCSGLRLRAFGEMVALLWAEGKHDAALRLEALWNDHAVSHHFALLCAYPVQGFGAAGQTAAFERICQHHAVVVPAESYQARDTDARSREVSRLQQKAAALEAEVAERQAAELALRERQATLTMAASLAGLGIWELDLESGELSLCDRCKSILSWHADGDTTLERLLSALHSDEVSSARGALETAVKSRTELAGEYRVVAKREVRWIAIRARYEESAQRLSGVMLDITAEKSAAAALERTVAERTARLRETVADLEAFSYSISHDMRTPLRAIHGYADILTQECELKPEHRGYLKRIGVAAQRMDRLIKDVLAFSRVARADLKLVPVDMASLVPSIIESNPALQAPAARIAIEGFIPPVVGNPSVLTQCLANLLHNAVKFVPRGQTPEIRLSAELHKQADESRVHIHVSDNGIGIEPAMQQQIFDIFHRLSSDYEGTGIGLAIVKKAVERMGGNVSLVSQPGQGSTFTLELLAAP